MILNHFLYVLTLYMNNWRNIVEKMVKFVDKELCLIFQLDYINKSVTSVKICFKEMQSYMCMAWFECTSDGYTIICLFHFFIFFISFLQLKKKNTNLIVTHGDGYFFVFQCISHIFPTRAVFRNEAIICVIQYFISVISNNHDCQMWNMESYIY